MPIEEYKKKKQKKVRVVYKFHSQAKHDEFQRYNFHFWGMLVLAVILMILAVIISAVVNALYNDGSLIENKYFKYDRYAIVSLIFGSLATASIFSGMESTKAIDHMKKLIEEDKNERPSSKTI